MSETRLPPYPLWFPAFVWSGITLGIYFLGRWMGVPDLDLEMRVIWISLMVVTGIRAIYLAILWPLARRELAASGYQREYVPATPRPVDPFVERLERDNTHIHAIATPKGKAIVTWQPGHDTDFLGLVDPKRRAESAEKIRSKLAEILEADPDIDLEAYAIRLGIDIIDVVRPWQKTPAPAAAPSFYEQQLLESVHQVETLAQLEAFERDARVKYADLIAKNPAFEEQLQTIVETTRRNIAGW